MFDQSKAFTSFSVKDIGEAKEFYGKILGLDARDGPMGVLELHLGDGPAVMVYPKDDHQPATYTVLNFPVASVDQAVEDLERKGIRLQRYDRPEMNQDERGISRDEEAGMAIAWFTDPAGNILSVMEAGPDGLGRGR